MAMNKKVIIERKKLYGDNFNHIADLWSNILSQPIEEKQVALMMADLKRVRIEYLDKEIAKFPEPTRAIELYASRDDSVMDRDNYMWIAENFETYKSL